MTHALVISSFVASSSVGGEVARLIFARFGFETSLLPTVMFGRHPGHGKPGGGPVSADDFQSVLSGIEANLGDKAPDIIVTGYFASPDQLEMTADYLRRIKRRIGGAKRPKVIVDPVIGDFGKGLFVAPAIAQSLIATLLPLADWICPNLFELQHIAGRELVKDGDFLALRDQLQAGLLVSSIPPSQAEPANDIGLLLTQEGNVRRLYHPFVPENLPNGLGDATTAFFAAGLAAGLDPVAAFDMCFRRIEGLVDYVEAQRAQTRFAAPGEHARSGGAELPLAAYLFGEHR